VELRGTRTELSCATLRGCRSPELFLRSSHMIYMHGSMRSSRAETTKTAAIDSDALDPADATYPCLIQQRTDGYSEILKCFPDFDECFGYAETHSPTIPSAEHQEPRIWIEYPGVLLLRKDIVVPVVTLFRFSCSLCRFFCGAVQPFVRWSLDGFGVLRHRCICSFRLSRHSSFLP